MAQEKKHPLKKLWEGWAFVGGIALLLYVINLLFGR
jgi:hypothetical protein